MSACGRAMVHEMRDLSLFGPWLPNDGKHSIGSAEHCGQRRQSTIAERTKVGSKPRGRGYNLNCLKQRGVISWWKVQSQYMQREVVAIAGRRRSRDDTAQQSL